MSILGAFIHHHRVKNRLTVKDLGDKFDPPVSAQYISRIQTGKTPLPATYIRKLCELFNLYPQEIVNVMAKDYAEKVKKKSGCFPAQGDDECFKIL